MTKVCTVQELQNIIPETLELEGLNFKDTKSLITSVIQAIEKSGKWEFVQYIQGQPSLFVVREEIRKTSKPKDPFSEFTETTNLIKEKIEDKVESLKKSTLPSSVKLPWQP